MCQIIDMTQCLSLIKVMSMLIIVQEVTDLKKMKNLFAINILSNQIMVY